MKKLWQTFCIRVLFTKFPFPVPAWMGPWLMEQAMGTKGVRVPEEDL